jgi:hypothetical protein
MAALLLLLLLLLLCSVAGCASWQGHHHPVPRPTWCVAEHEAKVDVYEVTSSIHHDVAVVAVLHLPAASVDKHTTTAM